MVSNYKLLAFFSTIALTALTLNVFPWNNYQHPANFKSLYTALHKGYDVSFSGSLSKCFPALPVAAVGAVIEDFQYLNDSSTGAERVEANYAVLLKNVTGSGPTAYMYNYWRQSIYPNQSINHFTSDVAYNKSYQTNVKNSECSFDQFSFSVIEYVKPAQLKKFADVYKALVGGKIVRYRASIGDCQYHNSLGITKLNALWGGIIQSFKIYAESSGIQEYVSFTNSHLIQNTDTPTPQFFNEIQEAKLFKNGTTIINNYFVGADNQVTTVTSWASCNINNGKQAPGISFYTSDHSII